MLVSKQQALCHPKPTLCTLQTALAPSHLFAPPSPPSVSYTCLATRCEEGTPGRLYELSRCSAGSWGWRREERGRGRAGRYRQPERSAGICWRKRVGLLMDKVPLLLLTHVFRFLRCSWDSCGGPACVAASRCPVNAVLVHGVASASSVAGGRSGWGLKAGGRGLLALSGGGISSVKEAKSVRQWLHKRPGRRAEGGKAAIPLLW